MGGDKSTEQTSERGGLAFHSGAWLLANERQRPIGWKRPRGRGSQEDCGGFFHSRSVSNGSTGFRGAL